MGVAVYEGFVFKIEVSVLKPQDVSILEHFDKWSVQHSTDVIQ